MNQHRVLGQVFAIDFYLVCWFFEFVAIDREKVRIAKRQFEQIILSRFLLRKTSRSNIMFLEGVSLIELR